MRIQHNIMAMNAYRNYKNNTSALSKNLERLSSGYKINRAGDDAAGLAISEKMRAQITGLEAAQKNVKDGISLVNTAEGAMQEIQDMLNRMVSLATQSANGTYDNEVDRKNLQAEVDQLRYEIDRIADSANFNGIKLLDGSLEPGREVVTEKSEDNMISLPDVNQKSDSADNVSILHTNGNPTATPTKFSVNLGNATFDNKTGSTFTVTIGDTALTLAGDDKDALDAAGIASALQKKYGDGTGNDKVELEDADGNKQAFKVTNNKGVLTFEQVNAPASAGEVVSAPNSVKISKTTAGAGAGGGTGTNSLEAGIQTHEGEGGGDAATTPSAIGGSAGTAIDVKGDGDPGTAAVYESTITLNNSIEAGNTIKIDSGSALTVVDDSDSGFDADSFDPTTSVKLSDVSDATKLATFIASQINDSDYTVTSDSGKLVYTAKNAGTVGGSSGPSSAPTAPNVVIAQGSASNSTVATVNATAISSATVEGEEPSAASLTLNASTLDKDAIKTAADGVANLASGSITIEKNSDDKLVLKVSGEIVGTSDETVDGSTTSFTFKTAAGEDGSTTSLGTVSFSSAPATTDITSSLDTGLTYTAAGSDQGSADETVKLEIDLSSALGSVDTADPEATLSSSDISAINSAFNALGNSGKVLINQEVDVDLSDISDDLPTTGTTTVGDLMQAIANRAKAAADAWNAENPDAEYTYTNARVSTSPTGTDNDVVGQANGDSLYILMDKTAKAGADDEGSSYTDYLIDVTQIQQGAEKSDARLASTNFTLTTDMVKDGNYLKIGDQTFVFKMSDDTKVPSDAIEVDLRGVAEGDLLTEAGIKLSNLTKDNSVFESMGFDGTKISFLEKAGTSEDLSTMPNLQAQFSYGKLAETETGKSLTLQIGDTSADYNRLDVNIKDMHVVSMGKLDEDGNLIAGSSINDIDISNPEGAKDAIDIIKGAINYVSSVRGTLGAISNRLDHTANNLSVMAENITDAESTIRDTDIAEEMMAYTKNNILVQSAQAMLAQANQVPQGVLQLLQ